MRIYFSLLMMPLLAAFVFSDCNRSAREERTVSVNSTAAANAAPVNPKAADLNQQQQSDGVKRISLAEAKKAYDAGTVVFIDTRGASSYQAKRIKGALNITTDDAAARADELKNTGKQIIAYCS